MLNRQVGAFILSSTVTSSPAGVPHLGMSNSLIVRMGKLRPREEVLLKKVFCEGVAGAGLERVSLDSAVSP